MSLEGKAWIDAEHLPNPFPAAADVRSYVPRPATESVLAYLEAKVESGPGWYELCGPGGVGKTLLLRLLADRVQAHAHPVYVPFPRLDPRGLASWVIDALDLPAGVSARAALIAAAQELSEARRPLTLLIDDGHQLPAETAAWLVSLCGEEAGIRVVVAVEEDAPRRAAEVDARAFAEPLELADIVPFVETQLARVGASEALCGLFSGAPLQSLALASRGVPRRIQRLGDARIVQALREGRKLAPEPDASDATPEAGVECAGRPRAPEHPAAEETLPPDTAPPANDPRRWRRLAIGLAMTALALALAALFFFGPTRNATPDPGTTTGAAAPAGASAEAPVPPAAASASAPAGAPRIVPSEPAADGG